MCLNTVIKAIAHAVQPYKRHEHLFILNISKPNLNNTSCKCHSQYPINKEREFGTDIEKTTSIKPIFGRSQLAPEYKLSTRLISGYN